MKMQTLRIHTSTQEEKDVALSEFFSEMRQYQERADEARKNLDASIPQLIRAIKINSGTSHKIRTLVWSCWNGDNIVGLCDVLCGLDNATGQAVLHLLAARIALGGDADPQIHRILEESDEFARFKEVASRTPDGCRVVYPLPLHDLEFLRAQVDDIEAFQTSKRHRSA